MRRSRTYQTSCRLSTSNTAIRHSGFWELLPPEGAGRPADASRYRAWDDELGLDSVDGRGVAAMPSTTSFFASAVNAKLPTRIESKGLPLQAAKHLMRKLVAVTGVYQLLCIMTDETRMA